MSAHLTLPDYHTHTVLCKHAGGTPRDYRAAAGARGMRQLAATDHCPTDDGFGVDHRMLLDEFPRYLDWVQEAAEAAGPELLLGVEADYYRGCARFQERFQNKHAFDLVLGSVHFLDYWSPDPALRGLARNPDAHFVWREYFTRIGELADTGLYDIVTHLDLPKKFGNALAENELREYALPALDCIAEAGMAIEINTSGLIHPPQACYPAPALLAWAAERGIGLTFGSDAHQPERVGAGFDVALDLARAAGFTHYREYRQRRFQAVPLPV
jgi:histidinol-phosphatase (PHP family)